MITRQTLERKELTIALATSSTVPYRTQHKSENGEKCECRVRPVLDRFVDRIDEIISDLAHRIDCLAALFLGIGNHALYAGACTPPSRAVMMLPTCSANSLNSSRSVCNSLWMSPEVSKAVLRASRVSLPDSRTLFETDDVAIIADLPASDVPARAATDFLDNAITR